MTKADWDQVDLAISYGTADIQDKYLTVKRRSMRGLYCYGTAQTQYILLRTPEQLDMKHSVEIENAAAAGGDLVKQ